MALTALEQNLLDRFRDFRIALETLFDEKYAASGAGMSDADKQMLTDLSNQIANKVDKVVGKGLSTEDFTTAYKQILDDLNVANDILTAINSHNTSTNAHNDIRTTLSGKVDKISGKSLSTNDFTAAYKTKLDNLDTNLSNKVDKVTGKSLSTNDFTDTYKDGLDSLLAGGGAVIIGTTASTTEGAIWLEV